MYEEQYLVSTGMPLDAALTLCHSLRREGLLEEFMEGVRSDVQRIQRKPIPQANRRLCDTGAIKSA